MKSKSLTLRNFVGTAGLASAAYILAGAAPDMRQYIRTLMM